VCALSTSSPARLRRYGAIAIFSMVLAMAAAFNLSKVPGIAGVTYYAEFADASGLHAGNIVQIGGIRVGRVNGLTLEGAKVKVKFTVDPDVEFGTESAASIEVLNLLGEKYLQVSPAGPGQIEGHGVIPLERTESAYDIVGVLGDLTTTTEHIDTDSLKSALNVISDTIKQSSPELEPTLRGVSQLSQVIASRDGDLRQLLKSANTVATLLASRRNDLVGLMKDANLVFAELRLRKEAIHQLLVNARGLAEQLRGVAADNQQQIGPALAQVNELLGTLISHEKQVKAVLHRVGPYSSILGNIIGTGPWFDAYVSNLAGLPTGEFVPGAY
jgi:phospholipid/cholesterol/gamma-HCH transport system substrate-binding protein